MTTVIYKLTDLFDKSKGVIPVLSTISRAEDDDVCFIIEGGCGGEFRIGGKRLPLKSGSCRTRRSELGAGIFTPKLVTNTRVFTLPSLEFSQHGVFTAELTADELIKLRESLITLDAELRNFSKRLLLLEEKIGTGHTFKL